MFLDIQFLERDTDWERVTQRLEPISFFFEYFSKKYDSKQKLLFNIIKN